MRILIATDLWLPKHHGVERLLHNLVAELRAQGDTVEVIDPDRFETGPSFLGLTVRFAISPERTIAAMIEAFAPEAVHLATEGPVGLAARNWCLSARSAFTSSYLTKLPEFAQARYGLSPEMLYARLRQFHAPTARSWCRPPASRRS